MTVTNSTKMLINKESRSLKEEIEKQGKIVDDLKAKKDSSDANYNSANDKLQSLKKTLADYDKDVNDNANSPKKSG